MVSERETLPVNGFGKGDLTSKWSRKERPYQQMVSERETLPVNGFGKRDLTSKWFQKGRPYQ